MLFVHLLQCLVCIASVEDCYSTQITTVFSGTTKYHNVLGPKAPVTQARRTARALKKWQFWPVRRRSLGVRHHALLVRRARWTNAMHSSSFVVCVGIFVHAQKCARSSTHEYTRGAHAGHALCVRRLRSSAHLAHRERTPSVLLTHVLRAQRSSSVFLTCAWRAHRVWPWVI